MGRRGWRLGLALKNNRSSKVGDDSSRQDQMFDYAWDAGVLARQLQQASTDSASDGMTGLVADAMGLGDYWHSGFSLY